MMGNRRMDPPYEGNRGTYGDKPNEWYPEASDFMDITPSGEPVDAMGTEESLRLDKEIHLAREHRRRDAPPAVMQFIGFIVTAVFAAVAIVIVLALVLVAVKIMGAM